MDKKNLVFGRVFTQGNFNNLLNKFSSTEAYFTAAKHIIHDPYSKRNCEIISEIYAYLKRNYRNEYFYKNTLLNNLLLGVHKPTTTTALTEVRVGKSKADFVLINGKAVVYEIKTGLDSFERLLPQVDDYFKAFDHVVVLTDEESKNNLLRKLGDSPVGVYTLTKRNRISCIRKPVKYSEKLDQEELFKILHKHEYESIILNKFGFLPIVPPVKYYKECRRLFCEIEREEGYSLYLNQLKSRNKIDVNDFDAIPYELKSLVYFSKYSKSEYSSLNSFLNRKFER